MKKLLSQILPAFGHELVACDTKTPVEKNDVYSIPVSNLVFDSRDVTEGSMFFALPGTHIHGNTFIPQALEKGANAIVFEGEIPADIQKECAQLIAKRHIKSALGMQAEGETADACWLRAAPMPRFPA